MILSITELTRMKAHAKEKRKTNTEKSTQILIDNGIQFESKNGGSHLVVQGKNTIIDYWPSTGSFITRKWNKKGRGVFNVIKLCS